MTQHPAGAWTRTSRIIKAPPETVYDAFMVPAKLITWLPPAQMTGTFHEFDARVGGGYRMSLFYPADETQHQGKTADLEDMVNVRFVELTPPHRIIEIITFVTTEANLKGEMTMTATFAPVPDGTEVTMLFENIPPGVRPEDNDTGARLSLDNLARILGEE